MAFLGSFGKFLGGAAKSIVRAVPTAIQGFAAGGPKGAFAGLIGGLAAGRGAGTMPPQQQIFSSIQTAFSQPAARFPSSVMTQQQAIPVSSEVMTLNQNIFNTIMKLAQGLGIVIRRPGSVVTIGRRIVARLLRFARANPGLTILNLLVNVGLTAFEATELITWYTTHGKKHRRIRVTNVKALNRSVRRLEGFRRLSHRVEMALSKRGASRSTFSRRRCPKCRKNPCCC